MALFIVSSFAPNKPIRRYDAGPTTGLLGLGSNTIFYFFYWAGNIPSSKHASKVLVEKPINFKAFLMIPSKHASLLWPILESGKHFFQETRLGHLKSIWSLFIITLFWMTHFKRPPNCLCLFSTGATGLVTKSLVKPPCSEVWNLVRFESCSFVVPSVVGLPTGEQLPSKYPSSFACLRHPLVCRTWTSQRTCSARALSRGPLGQPRPTFCKNSFSTSICPWFSGGLPGDHGGYNPHYHSGNFSC